MDNGDVIAHQAHYIDRIVKKFRMANSNPVTTPSLKEQLITDKTQQDINFPYRQAVGSLLYISNSTRPDIAQAVHHAARFVGSPTEQNVQAVKRILKYLKGTNIYGIIFKKTGNTNLVGLLTPITATTLTTPTQHRVSSSRRTDQSYGNLRSSL